MMKRIAFTALVIVISIGIVHLHAQQMNKKKVVAASHAQTQPADMSLTDPPAFFYFPEFYSFWPVNKNDTVLKYECFGANDSLVNSDTLHSMDAIKFILLVKTYTDYTRTYVDPDGRPQPMPVLSKVYRYDRSGPDKWTAYEYASRENSYFKERRDEIIRSDTTSGVNPDTGNKQITIRKYYKTEPVNP